MATARKHQPEPVSLAAVVSAALSSSDEPDPHQLAEEIIPALPTNELRAALRITLPDYIRKRISSERMSRRTTTRASSRWDNITALSTELAILRDRVFAQGEWKLFGDCGPDDCLDLAAHRAKSAAEHEAMSKRYEATAKLLKKHKAATVRALPAEVVQGLFDA